MTHSGTPAQFLLHIWDGLSLQQRGGACAALLWEGGSDMVVGIWTETNTFSPGPGALCPAVREWGVLLTGLGKVSELLL